jgi:hypothetical protein
VSLVRLQDLLWEKESESSKRDFIELFKLFQIISIDWSQIAIDRALKLNENSLDLKLLTTVVKEFAAQSQNSY